MKGLVPLLEAVAKLRTERDVELTVIGRPQEGGRVDKAITRLGLSDVVHCVSGISDDALARLYGQAEVAVVPSLYEGFSLPAIEAMACGVAVVATTGGALPEVVGTDGETGLLVAPDDPGALAGAIARLLDDPALRARLGAAGRERVINRFTWQVTAAGTAACYDAAAGGEAAAGGAGRGAAGISGGCRRGGTSHADGGLRQARACDRAIASSTSVAASGDTPSRRPGAARRWWPSTPGPRRWPRCVAPWRPWWRRGSWHPTIRPPPCRGMRWPCRSPTPPSTASSPRRSSSTFPTTWPPCASWRGCSVPAGPWP